MARSTDSPRFNQALISIIDQVIPGTGATDFTQIDSGQDFLREVMHFDDAGIHRFRTEAETFFRDTFGLDFTQVTADANTIKSIPGAILAPFRVNPQALYWVLFHNNIGSLSATNLVRDGGFFVQVTEPGVRYHGTFGGGKGKPAFPGELLPFGFYNIVSLNGRTGQPAQKFRPIIIDYLALAPVQKTPDGDMVLHCGLRHPQWGSGVMRGVQIIAPADSSHLRVTKRNVLTFPGSLVP